MKRLRNQLKAKLRPAWYRTKRVGYRLEVLGERMRRSFPNRTAMPGDGPLDPPARAISSTRWHAAQPRERFLERVDAEETLHREPPPQTIEDELHPHFRFDLEHVVAPNVVCVLPGGRVWGDTGAIVTRENELIDDLSIAWQTDSKSKGQHPIFANWRYRSMHLLAGTSAALTTDGAKLYYHWLFQLLPRLDVLERGGFALDEIDHFIVNRALHAYERDTLERIGVPLARIVETRNHPHIRAERLLAPSIPLHGSQFSPQLVRFVRERVGGLAPAESCQPGTRRLYLTRSGAGYRNVVNEAEVRARVEAQGFEAVALEELSFADQVQIMTEAGIVIGPHGGGMSNLVFCAPGTKVGEIFAEEYVAPWFWFLATMTGLPYHYMIGAREPRPALAERWDSGASMKVDLDKLDRFLLSLTG